ncbi:hypothetical protein [Enterobacter quasiroggenkampii]|uniref:hypothetical protein n=1 Tax=Enterobacter quasiroggenkampii TaxID=2497436 RepID=UPI0021D2B622|nr:hypothetical protein [Enterobacter quasiroggenkampii]MCU6345967.1 hypothetical protein [Enterobacter quasiroggenkampii]
MNSYGIENLPLPEITVSDLSERLSGFGFIECQDVSVFLSLVCDRKPDSKDLFWIKGKIRACLSRHDNGNEYFEPLRIIEKELEKAYESLPSR